jgi:nicotinamide-nucleotide amidase
VAGPGTDTGAGGEAAPVGMVYIGLADAAGVHVTTRQFFGDRERIRIFTAQMALDMLRRRMLGK